MKIEEKAFHPKENDFALNKHKDNYDFLQKVEEPWAENPWSFGKGYRALPPESIDML